MTDSTVPIVENIMSANDQIARENRAILDAAGCFGINIMASPGAGKTSTILATIEALSEKYSIAVIEGDTAPVTIDSDKVKAKGIPAVQINTGGGCHLNAPIVTQGLKALDLTGVDLVIVENVGNLVCPSGVDLGTHVNVVIASIPEGDDKPYKYPNIYRGIDVIIINKMDLMPYIDFNMQYFLDGLEMLNPGLINFPISATKGEGIEAWAEWLEGRIKEAKVISK
ncbi:MAG: hydrogenase nickel incorporation protein HypB [Anaerolineae bacterium]|jgi:hydrogenase nickel incorporation protein HypB|nr:hydrogenase nickel incorporation protein HypB [Anaerolineae bacterium]